VVPSVVAECDGPVVVLAVPGLAACGGEDNPKPAPLPTPSTTTGPSHSATTEGTTPQAFVRYYVQVLNDATADGDTQRLREISAQHCKSCHAMRRTIERIYRAGGHIESNGWIIKQIKLLGQQADGIIDVGLTVTVGRERVIPSQGAPPQSHAAATHGFLVGLEQMQSGWRVGSLELVP
jgi:hypothetical protein